MASRRSNDESRDLRLRVVELESRVRWLERRLKKVAAAAKLKEPKQKSSNRPRCPGCFAEVPRGKRYKNCVYCGFSFEAVKPLKPRRVRRSG
ncbi:MAG: hypothetical protein JNM17_24270 [Archangium sp.]|nr:hypothetical protein [Archangium sp.]